jgi:hypothetical protein
MLKTVMTNAQQSLTSLIVQECQLSDCTPLINVLQKEHEQPSSNGTFALKEIAIQGNPGIPKAQLQRLLQYCPQSITLAVGCHHAGAWPEWYFVKSLELYGSCNNAATVYSLLQSRRDVWLEGYHQRKRQAKIVQSESPATVVHKEADATTSITPLTTEKVDAVIETTVSITSQTIVCIDPLTSGTMTTNTVKSASKKRRFRLSSLKKKMLPKSSNKKQQPLAQ